MKKLLSYVLFLLTPLFAYAGNTYTIFRVVGEVKRCPLTSQEWIYAVRRDTVKLSDRIYIPEGGEIRILSSENGIIYSCSDAGQFDVKQIIEKSKESISTVLGAVTGELLTESVSRTAAGKTSRVHGATSRGRDKIDNSYERKLAGKILKGEKHLLVELEESEESYKFKISSRRNCKVCVICLLPGSVSLCLPASGVQIGKGETVLDLPEIVPSQESCYRVFRVKRLFDDAELCRILTKESQK